MARRSANRRSTGKDGNGTRELITLGLTQKARLVPGSGKIVEFADQCDQRVQILIAQ